MIDFAANGPYRAVELDEPLRAPYEIVDVNNDLLAEAFHPEVAAHLVKCLNFARGRTLPVAPPRVLARVPFVGPFTAEEFEGERFDVLDAEKNLVCEVVGRERAVVVVAMLVERWQRDTASKAADAARAPTGGILPFVGSAGQGAKMSDTDWNEHERDALRRENESLREQIESWKRDEKERAELKDKVYARFVNDGRVERIASRVFALAFVNGWGADDGTEQRIARNAVKRAGFLIAALDAKEHA